MICFMDIDGTLANATKRFKSAGPEPKTRGKEYTEWLKKVQTPSLLLKDECVPGMWELACAISYSFQLVYLTGRSESYRATTEQWLKSNYANVGRLIMRPKGNKMRNGELKEMLIKAFFTGPIAYETSVIVIDDDYHGDIEKACRRNGWTFLKAKSGGYWNAR